MTVRSWGRVREAIKEDLPVEVIVDLRPTRENAASWCLSGHSVGPRELQVVKAPWRN